MRAENATANRPHACHPAFIFILVFIGLFLLHTPLLRLPYIWDEAGYYVPAARDLMLKGSLIPLSSVSNAHPPLVMAWLAVWWKLAGYTPLVTRTAMLLIAAFALLGVFSLAQRVANTEVAVASAICTAVYPVFFTQSSLAHLDMAAAAFTFWGLHSYVNNRWAITAVWFSLSALAKETAILAPVALFGWELLCPVLAGYRRGETPCLLPRDRWKSLSLLAPVVPLGLWFVYHYRLTGYVFGNPEYFRYNVAATLHPLRMLLAGGMRVWQMLGYMHLYFLTIAAALAMWCAPQVNEDGQRPRISIPVQIVFLVPILAYVVAMAVVGGAVLARYMLPVVPFGIILCVSTLWRRVHYWRAVITIVALTLVAALFVNPPYGFSFEDNLAYRDYILLHEHAEDFVEARYPMGRVLTAWPASDEISRPDLGYVTRPLKVVRIENFSFEELTSAADIRSQFEVALVFSTKYLPRNSLIDRWPAWERIQTRFFGFHRDVPPAVAAQILAGRVVYTDYRNGQWIGVIEMERMIDARLRSK